MTEQSERYGTTPVEWTEEQWQAVRWWDDYLKTADQPRKQLTEAILDIAAHSTPFGEDDDGFVNGGYLVSVGAMHRALGVVGHSAAPCPSCPHPHPSGDATIEGPSASAELAPKRTGVQGRGDDGAGVGPNTSPAPLRISRSVMEREIGGALKQSIDAHGPISRNNLSSASKRIVSALKRLGVFRSLDGSP